MLRFVAHDESEGISPDGWLSDRISVGVLISVFMPELVDTAVDGAGAREQRRRLLPAPAGGVLHVGAVAVSGPELLLRAGDDEAGRWPELVVTRQVGCCYGD